MMTKNIDVMTGNNRSQFASNKNKQGHSELDNGADKGKLKILRRTLATGKLQLERGQTIDGEAFMKKLSR